MISSTYKLDRSECKYGYNYYKLQSRVCLLTIAGYMCLMCMECRSNAIDVEMVLKQGEGKTSTTRTCCFL